MSYPWPRSEPRRRFPVPPLRFLALVGMAGLVGAGGLLAVALWPSSTVIAFREAGPCATVPTGPTPSCYLMIPMQVTDVHQQYHRAGNRYLIALRAGSLATTARVDAFLVWFPRYRAGEQVQAQVWNGRITMLAGSGGTFITLDSPLSREQDFQRAAAYLALVAWLPFLLALVDHWGRRLFKFLGIGAQAPQPIP